MPEPLRRRLRPISVTRSVLLPPLLACLVLAGCGDTGTAPRGSAATQAPGKVGSCPVDSPAIAAAKPVTRADLDGDGTADDVRLTDPGSACPNLVFARVGRSYLAAQVPADGPPVRTAFGVSVPGERGQLLATRQEHPRGGFQVRLYGRAGDALTELQVSGHALIPFVATDVQEHPLSVDCAPGGLVLTEAVAHEPAGVAFAWDVKRTSYAVKGGVVTAGATDEVADNVLPAQLEARYPELTGYAMFKSCRAPG